MTKVADLFDVRYGHSLELNRLTITSPERGIAFVSRKMGDNGISAYVELIAGISPNPAGELTCALSGNGVLMTFVQERPYYTGFHVACLRPKTPMGTAQLLYYCACIRANRYKFSWGRQANRTLPEIVIPDLDDIPDWVTDQSLNAYAGKEAPANVQTSMLLDTASWRIFLLSDLFELRKGTRLTKAEMVTGETPFIGAIDKNNGVSGFVGQPPLHSANTLTVSYNGSVAEAFYQPKPYRCSDDINVLYPKFSMNATIALFIATVIRHEKYRFNYGRKWHLERMEQSEIRLPATPEGKPDFTFMENYIKTLPFSSELLNVTDEETALHFHPGTFDKQPSKAAEEAAREYLQPSLPYVVETDDAVRY